MIPCTTQPDHKIDETSQCCEAGDVEAQPMELSGTAWLNRRAPASQRTGSMSRRTPSCVSLIRAESPKRPAAQEGAIHCFFAPTGALRRRCVEAGWLAQVPRSWRDLGVSGSCASQRPSQGVQGLFVGFISGPSENGSLRVTSRIWGAAPRRSHPRQGHESSATNRELRGSPG